MPCLHAKALQIWPWLNEFNGAVLSCFTRFRTTIYTDVLLIKSEDSLRQGKSLFSDMGQENCEQNVQVLPDSHVLFAIVQF